MSSHGNELSFNEDVMTTRDFTLTHEERQPRYGRAHRELRGFLNHRYNLLEVDSYASKFAKAGGILVSEFTVPAYVDLRIYQENTTCEATQYDSQGREAGSKTFDQDDPLQVHSMISSHNWDTDPYQHILGVSYSDGESTYSYSFDEERIQEVGKRVIPMFASQWIRLNSIH